MDGFNGVFNICLGQFPVRLVGVNNNRTFLGREDIGVRGGKYVIKL